MMYKTQKAQTISQKKNTVYLLKMQTSAPKKQAKQQCGKATSWEKTVATYN